LRHSGTGRAGGGPCATVVDDGGDARKERLMVEVPDRDAVGRIVD
jgi:hypothetical protein